MATTPIENRDARHVRWLLAGLGLLLLLRITLVLASPLELYADEAQYWRWGQTLAWGYYSKPPAIAWLIEATTQVLGTGAWQVRIAAPFLHVIAALLIFVTGRAMADARAGLFAALAYILMPSVTLSSFVLSTDGVLMPFWCAGLYLFWRLRSEAGGPVSALLLGAALGMGILSKYAMLYFLAGIVIACTIDPPSRRAMFSANGALVALMAGLLVLPHLAWNVANSFATVSHTVDNANLGGELLNPEHVLTWFTDQLGMFGPVGFPALLAGLWLLVSRARQPSTAENWLLAFILPVLIFILVQSVVSRAHANWTATAYPGAALLIALWFSTSRPALLWTSTGINALMGVLFSVVVLLPPAATEPLGIDNALKRTRGWQASADRIFSEAERLGATAILVDEREAWHGLDFYGQDRTLPLISWRRHAVPKSFAEGQPLQGEAAGRVLVASLHPALRPRLRGDFAVFESVGEVRIDLGRRASGCPVSRTFHLYLAEGHAPPERTPEWEERYEGMSEFRPPPCPAGRTRT